MSQQDIRQAILEYQRKNNLPDYTMCDLVCMNESQWDRFVHGPGFDLTTFQQIMFIIQTETPLPD